jgi:hypothetical protein
VAQLVVSRGLSVRETEAMVRQISEGQRVNSQKNPQRTVVTQILKTAGVKVHLHQRPAGNGLLVIDFADREARDEMVELIKSYQGD